MGILKLQVQISLDGFIAGPSGEMDWLVQDWDQELKDYVANLMENVNHILLGRKLAEGFIPYWSQHAGQEGAEFMNNTPKTVFSKTLNSSPWPGTQLWNGDAASRIRGMKSGSASDFIVYGGSGFVSSLIAGGLIDELHLLINPTILGKGLPVFRQNENIYPIQRVAARVFPCGITVLHYRLLK